VAHQAQILPGSGSADWELIGNLTQNARVGGSFSGGLQKSASSWAYKTLKWELSENDLESQSTHSEAVHTAFTFVHDCQPFFLRVEIKGKLKKVSDKLKSKWMKFPSNMNKDDGSTVTLIDFRDHMRFTTPLDERAESLPYEMEQANLHAIPMEVPDPKPVTFMEVPPNSRPTNMNFTYFPTWRRPQTQIFGSAPTQQLQASAPTHLLQNTQSSLSADYTDPMLANLAQALFDLQAVDVRVPRYRGSTESMSPPSPNVDTSTVITNGKTMSVKEKQKLSEEQAVLQLLVPGLMIFVRMIAGLLGFFRQRPALATANPGEDQRQPVGEEVTEMETLSDPAFLEMTDPLSSLSSGVR